MQHRKKERFNKTEAATCILPIQAMLPEDYLFLRLICSNKGIKSYTYVQDSRSAGTPESIALEERIEPLCFQRTFTCSQINCKISQ